LSTRPRHCCEKFATCELRLVDCMKVMARRMSPRAACNLQVRWLARRIVATRVVPIDSEPKVAVPDVRNSDRRMTDPIEAPTLDIRDQVAASQVDPRKDRLTSIVA